MLAVNLNQPIRWRRNNGLTSSKVHDHSGRSLAGDQPNACVLVWSFEHEESAFRFGAYLD
jgi:hypothetical protein